MNKVNLNDELKKLEEITAKLEKEDISLDESLKLFEQGINIYRKSIKELESAKNKINLLIDDEVVDFNENGENNE